MGKHSNSRISAFQVVDECRILHFNRKTEKYFKEFTWFGGTYAVTTLQAFVWIFNHVLSHNLIPVQLKSTMPNLVK